MKLIITRIKQTREISPRSVLYNIIEPNENLPTPHGFENGNSFFNCEPKNHRVWIQVNMANPNGLDETENRITSRVHCDKNRDVSKSAII